MHSGFHLLNLRFNILVLGFSSGMWVLGFVGFVTFTLFLHSIYLFSIRLHLEPLLYPLGSSSLVSWTFHQILGAICLDAAAHSRLLWNFRTVCKQHHFGLTFLCPLRRRLGSLILVPLYNIGPPIQCFYTRGLCKRTTVWL
jgi:hypothetical protein